MKKHSFEVPFIANYRREYIEPELDRNDLWKILRYDEKVCACVDMCVQNNCHIIYHLLLKAA